MRPSPVASPAAWPTRIFRPWLIASAAGALIGTTLLQLSSDGASEVQSYAESAPRAAVQDLREETSLSNDPFAPAASLAAPPDTPILTPASAESPLALPAPEAAPAP